MSYRNREIESKLITDTDDLTGINRILAEEFGGDKKKMIFGSSTDIYWTVQDPRATADFLRVRERDGCVQVTVKGKDKGNNLNRMEREYITTDPLETVVGVHTAQLGKPAGIVSKTYYVYWLNKTDTVCCYVITEPRRSCVFIEVEASSTDKMLDLETRVYAAMQGQVHVVEGRAPGSLYEMFILKQTPLPSVEESHDTIL